MNIALDEDALAGLKTTSRERKLSTAERIAIYAFHVKGVPAKLIARTFGVRANAIYYITNWTHTAAHENAKNAYEQMGEEKVWAEIVTDEQTASINEGMNKLLQGNPSMTADVAGTIAVALALDEPEQLLSYLKQQAMMRAETLRPIDEYLADKWDAVGECIAESETKVGDVKRRPAAAP